MLARDRRAFARIEADLACHVEGPRGTVGARVRDISLGGAGIVACHKVGEVGDVLTLAIELLGGLMLHVQGTVVRVEDLESATRHGVRFDDLSAEAQEQLGHFIDTLLVGEGAGERRHPRIYRRVEVSCRTAEEFRAVMDNVSRGGLALECGVPLVAGENVTVLVGAGPELKPLELTGSVVHVRELSSGRHKAGIRFAPLSEASRQALDDYLKALVHPVGPS